jgi:hypothetical protein
MTPRGTAIDPAPLIHKLGFPCYGNMLDYAREGICVAYKYRFDGTTGDGEGHFYYMVPCG